MKVKTGKNNVLELKDKSFASGGQGGIFEVVKSPYPFQVAVKIYHKPEAAKTAQKKIEYMVSQNPFKLSPLAVQQTFAWPLEAIYDYRSGKFIGYMMVKIEDAKPLWHLITPKGFKDTAWLKFNLDNPDSLLIRLKLIYNVTQALKVLNDSGQYQVIDLKPINMMLKNYGHMVIIDTDSFQIGQNGRVMFHAEAATGEYCPAEFHKGQVNFQKDYVQSSWDYFAYAVTAYQVLFCIHPFTGMHPQFQTQEELIQAGIWAHGNKSSMFKSPPPHTNFHLLSPTAQAQFKKCFDVGHLTPRTRPDYNSWIQVWADEIAYVQRNKVRLTSQFGGKKTKGKPANPFVRPTRPQIPQAVIHHFQIKPSTKVNQAMLEWSVSNAQQVLVDGKTVANVGQIIIDSCSAKQFELRAIDFNAQTTTRHLAYTPDSEIRTFKYQVQNGFVDLHWAVSGKVGQVLINGIRHSSIGKIQIPANQVNKSYELEVVSSGGFRYNKSVVVQSIVQVIGFDKVLERTSAKLSWNVENCSMITLNGQSIAPKGSIAVALTNQDWTLKAWDVLGNVVEKTISILVQPLVKVFEVNSNDYSCELKWDVWYAKYVSIDGARVGLAGSRRVSRISKVFEMTIEDFQGRIIRKTLRFDAPKMALKPTASILSPGGRKGSATIGTVAQIKDRIAKINKIIN